MRLAWKHSEGAGYAGGFYFFPCVSQSRRGRKKSCESQNKRGYVQKAHILLEGILLSLYFCYNSHSQCVAPEPNQTVGRVLAEHHLSA